jgi:hypothetical protein
MTKKQIKRLTKASYILPPLYEGEDIMCARFMTEKEAEEYITNLSKEDQDMYWKLYLDDLIVKAETARLLYSATQNIKDFANFISDKIKKLLSV